MKIFAAITAQEWKEVQQRGFARFYLEQVITSAIVMVAVFATVNFFVNFEDQTTLMVSGMMTVAVGTPVWGVIMWLMLKSRFSGQQH